jgi:hypothetical protein
MADPALQADQLLSPQPQQLVAGECQQAVYLLWTYEYCEMCEETHQGLHRTDQNIVAVYATHMAARQYCLAHPDYITSHDLWYWGIEEWIQDLRYAEPGKFADPAWRSAVEAIEAGLRMQEHPGLPLPQQPPEWPYRWYYDRQGHLLVERPDLAMRGEANCA